MSDLLIYIILGIVQGFTEPLPISSSGHLLIAEYLLGVDEQGLGISYAAFINFGSTIAICIYFWDKLVDLLFGFFRNIKTRGKEAKVEMDYCLKIIVATIPLFIVGVGLKLLDVNDEINIKMVGISLFITGLLLLFVSFKKSGNKLVANMTYKDAIIIGLFQAIAFMPGLSRSGMTIAAALIVGYNNRDAFDFSFIMFVPASLGALLFSLLDIISDPNVFSYIGYYIISLLLAGVFTYIGLILTKKIILASKIRYFAYYCFIVASSIIILSF